jgi:hypothetical protein
MCKCATRLEKMAQILDDEARENPEPSRRSLMETFRVQASQYRAIAKVLKEFEGAE